jgi:hypothetical protein
VEGHLMKILFPLALNKWDTYLLPFMDWDSKVSQVSKVRTYLTLYRNHRYNNLLLRIKTCNLMARMVGLMNCQFKLNKR